MTHQFVFGVITGILTLVFFMILVLAALFGLQVPCASQTLPVIVLALGAGFSASLMGGAAEVRGQLPFLGAANPIAVSAAGGIAVFVIVLFTGQYYLTNTNFCPLVPPQRTAELLLSEVDDVMIVKINDVQVAHQSFNETRGWINIFPNIVKRGTNRIEVWIINGQYGGCGGKLEWRFDGRVESSLTREWKKDQAPPNAVCATEAWPLTF